ncbi:MAG: hypothetical protein JO114_03925 [Planctomycetaceae bacterium]|nr:hypothetical protein [Planctomycetaceae bacterium]
MVFVRALGGASDHRQRESGPQLAVLNRLVQATGSAAPLATTVLERWHHFSGAVLLHLAIILLICLYDPAAC